MPICAAFLLLALTLPRSTTAQSVTGVLVDGTTSEPLAGAYVLLLDSEGRQVAGRLTDAAGRFQVAAPAPGRYTLRAERIGYETYESPPLDLGGDERVVYRFETVARAIDLEGIKVPARQRCAPHPGRGPELAAVWEQARQALGGTAVTDAEARYRFRVVHSEKRLEPSTLRVLEERTRPRQFTGREAFTAIPAEQLAREGFVRETADGIFFYAPDLDLLLSDTFIEMHCFRLVEGDGNAPGLVGLAFDPAPGRRHAAIRGTLWVDRQTSELRHLEYRYVRLPWDVPTASLGGQVDFTRLDTGAWIISRWWIRTPHLERRRVHLPGGPAQERMDIAALREEGSVVVDVRDRSGRVGGLPEQEVSGQADNAADVAGGQQMLQSGLRIVRRSSLPAGTKPRLAGRVLDAGTGRPVPGVVLRLVGIAGDTVTDGDGWFRLTDLPSGEQRIEAHHPEYGRVETGMPLRPWEEVVVEVVLVYRW